MSGDKPTDLDAMRECLDDWLRTLEGARRGQAYVGEREEVILRAIRVLEAKIATAEAAAEQRIVTEDN